MEDSVTLFMEALRSRKESPTRNPIAPALALLLVSLGPARASGGFWCKAEDPALKLSVKASAPRSGGPLVSHESVLQVLDQSAPTELRAFRFKREDLIQHWLDGREGGSLKLRFQRQGSARASFDGVSLIVDAPAIDEGRFEGRYTLTVQRRGSAESAVPFEASGSVSCSAD
jgi:hypothetical protein